MQLKVTRIGNSRGVRLPAASLRRYRMAGVVIMEEKTEGILLRPTGPVVEKLSWEDTAREMEACREDWGDWAAVDADGLAEIPWDSGRNGRVAEARTQYKTKAGKSKRP